MKQKSFGCGIFCSKCVNPLYKALLSMYNMLEKELMV